MHSVTLEDKSGRAVLQVPCPSVAVQRRLQQLNDGLKTKSEAIEIVALEVCRKLGEDAAGSDGETARSAISAVSHAILFGPDRCMYNGYLLTLFDLLCPAVCPSSDCVTPFVPPPKAFQHRTRTQSSSNRSSTTFVFFCFAGICSRFLGVWIGWNVRQTAHERARLARRRRCQGVAPPVCPTRQPVKCKTSVPFDFGWGVTPALQWAGQTRPRGGASVLRFPNCQGPRGRVLGCAL